MSFCKIADLYVEIHVRYPRCSSQIEKYKVEEIPNRKPDIRIKVTQKMVDEYIEAGKDSDIMEGWPIEMQWDEVEYMLAGQLFYHQILQFGGMLVHSSAIVMNDKAYLFSGKSGAGKSTHTNLWLEKFGKDIYILNEDKPAVRRIGDKYYAYGTPWSGKTNTNVNKKAEVKSIVFLGQAKENTIRKLDSKESFTALFEQTDRKKAGMHMIALMDMMEKMVTDIPMYHMDCNISLEAVELSYKTITEKE